MQCYVKSYIHTCINIICQIYKYHAIIVCLDESYRKVHKDALLYVYFKIMIDESFLC